MKRQKVHHAKRKKDRTTADATPFMAKRQKKAGETTLVEKAFMFARKSHRHEKRLSGDAYINHPVGVKQILEIYPISEKLLCAALLHDVLEHSKKPKKTGDELHLQFGDEIFFLVDAVSKDGELRNKNERDRHYQEKILCAIRRDYLVMFLKAADLLDNVKTLQYLTPANQERWIIELKHFYMKSFLENFSLIPDVYQGFFHYLIAEIQKVIDEYELLYIRGPQIVETAI